MSSTVTDVKLSIGKNKIGQWTLSRINTKMLRGKKVTFSPKFTSFDNRNDVAKAFVLNLFRINQSFSEVKKYELKDFNKIIISLDWVIMKSHDRDSWLSNRISFWKVEAIRAYEL